MTAHDVDALSWLSSHLPCAIRWGFPTALSRGKARLRRLVPRNTCTTVTFTQVNSEGKGALAKPGEAVWSYYNDNYNDRFDEICCHWGGNTLSPKPVTHNAKLEKAKAKELATKLG